MKVLIRKETYDKIMYWVNKADFEVSGFGKVLRHEDHLEITEAYLLKQEGGSAHTDIDANALASLMYTSRNEPGDLRFWWHSHVKMATFWSGTDTQTIKELGANGWILATVFNQKNEHRTALGYKAETAFGDTVIISDELKLEVINATPDAPLWDEEFDRCVKRYTPPKPVYNYGYEYEHVRTERTLLHTDSAWEGYRFNDMGYDPGLMGYGVAQEAKALGMSEASYVAILDSKDMRAIEKLEQKLIYLDGKGKLT